MITLIMLGVRIGVALFLIPMFSSFQSGIIKIAIGAIIAYVALPFVHPVVANNIPVFMGLLVANAGMGLVSGLILRFIVLGVETVGGIADMEVGFSFAHEINPSSNDSSTPITILLTLLMTGVFFGVNGQDYFIQAVIDSFNVNVGANWIGISNLIGASLLSGLEMALPLIITLLIFDITFGTISRYSSMINVFSAGFTIRVGIGLWILFLLIPFFDPYFQNIGISAFQNIYSLVGLR